MAIEITPSEVRERTGATVTEWPDARIAPILAVAKAKASAAQSGAALTGDALTIWKAGVIALVWHLLTSGVTGGGGAVKKRKDGDLETEYDTKAQISAWYDEACMLIPALARKASTMTVIDMVPGEDEVTLVDGYMVPSGISVTVTEVTEVVTTTHGYEPGMVPFAVTESMLVDGAESIHVSFAPAAVSSGFATQIYALTNIGAVLPHNCIADTDGGGVILTLDADNDGIPMAWAVGDKGTVHFVKAAS